MKSNEVTKSGPNHKRLREARQRLYRRPACC